MIFFIRLASGLLCWCEGFVCVFSNKSCSSELNSTTLYFQILLLVKEMFKNVTLSFYFILFLREGKQNCVDQTKTSPALSMGFSLFWTFTSKLKTWGLRSQTILGLQVCGVPHEWILSRLGVLGACTRGWALPEEDFLLLLSSDALKVMGNERIWKGNVQVLCDGCRPVPREHVDNNH